jgi:hypothetical protein
MQIEAPESIINNELLLTMLLETPRDVKEGNVTAVWAF